MNSIVEDDLDLPLMQKGFDAQFLVMANKGHSSLKKMSMAEGKSL